MSYFSRACCSLKFYPEAFCPEVWVTSCPVIFWLCCFFPVAWCMYDFLSCEIFLYDLLLLWRFEQGYLVMGNFFYLIPIKVCAPLNFAPLIFAPLIFAHPQSSRPFDFRAPLFCCKFAVFHSFVAFFLLPLIFAHLYCANLLPLIFVQDKCANIKGREL